jgi:hypothetical protein
VRLSRRRLPEEGLIPLGVAAEAIEAVAIARVRFFENDVKLCSTDRILAIAGPCLEAMVGTIKRLQSFGGPFGHSE